MGVLELNRNKEGFWGDAVQNNRFLRMEMFYRAFHRSDFVTVQVSIYCVGSGFSLNVT